MRRFNQNIILYLVAITFFIEMLDSTIIVTAIPNIANFFHTTISNINFAITTYVSSIAIFLTITPWLSNRFGDKKMFNIGIFIFTLSSLFCGLSNNICQFFIAQILQGLGASIMVPIGRILVLRNTPKEEYLKVISIMVWPGLIAPVIGPILGAWITENYSWEWMYFVNIPIGLFALCLAIKVIPANMQNINKIKFDFFGCILFMSEIILLISFMHSFVHNSDLKHYKYIIFASCILIFIILFKHLKTKDDAIIDINCFNIENFRKGIFYSSFFRITTGAIPFVLPLYFQAKFGMSLVESASLLLYLFLGNISMKFFTTKILKTFNIFKIILIFTLILVGTITIISFLNINKEYYVVIILLFICGSSRSMLFTSYMSLIFKDMPKTKISHANAINNIFFQLTFGMGVAITAIFFSLSHIFTLFFPQLNIYQVTLLLFAVIGILPIIFINK